MPAEWKIDVFAEYLILGVTGVDKIVVVINKK